jgi:hypothetical protein
MRATLEVDLPKLICIEQHVGIMVMAANLVTLPTMEIKAEQVMAT